MQNLQEIFIKSKEKKSEIKKIKQMYTDSLENLGEYRKLEEDMKKLKERKKQIEQEAKNGLGNEWVRMESLKKDVSDEKEIMANLAINQLLKGEEVIVQDEQGAKHEPRYSVNFKKAEEGTEYKKAT